MAKAKKTKNIEEVEIKDQSEQLGEVTLSQKRIDDCEWVFQFDEDEPQVFAWTDDDINKDEEPKVIFSISNIENSFISFKDKKTEKSFKLFARELSDEGRELRNKQKEAFKQLQNGSENKETQA